MDWLTLLLGLFNATIIDDVTPIGPSVGDDGTPI